MNHAISFAYDVHQKTLKSQNGQEQQQRAILEEKLQNKIPFVGWYP